jgi:hypothetical protein
VPVVRRGGGGRSAVPSMLYLVSGVPDLPACWAPARADVADLVARAPVAFSAGALRPCTETAHRNRIDGAPGAPVRGDRRGDWAVHAAGGRDRAPDMRARGNVAVRWACETKLLPSGVTSPRAPPRVSVGARGNMRSAIPYVMTPTDMYSTWLGSDARSGSLNGKLGFGLWRTTTVVDLSHSRRLARSRANDFFLTVLLVLSLLRTKLVLSRVLCHQIYIVICAFEV